MSCNAATNVAPAIEPCDRCVGSPLAQWSARTCAALARRAQRIPDGTTKPHRAHCPARKTAGGRNGRARGGRARALGCRPGHRTLRWRVGLAVAHGHYACARDRRADRRGSVRHVYAAGVGGTLRAPAGAERAALVADDVGGVGRQPAVQRRAGVGVVGGGGARLRGAGLPVGSAGDPLGPGAVRLRRWAPSSACSCRAPCSSTSIRSPTRGPAAEASVRRTPSWRSGRSRDVIDAVVIPLAQVASALVFAAVALALALRLARGSRLTRAGPDAGARRRLPAHGRGRCVHRGPQPLPRVAADRDPGRCCAALHARLLGCVRRGAGALQARGRAGAGEARRALREPVGGRPGSRCDCRGCWRPLARSRVLESRGRRWVDRQLREQGEPELVRPRSRADRGERQPRSGGGARSRPCAHRRTHHHRGRARIRPHGARERASGDPAPLLAAGSARVARADHVGRGSRAPADRARPARRCAAAARRARDPADARRRSGRGPPGEGCQAPARAERRCRRGGGRGAVPRARPCALPARGARSRGRAARRSPRRTSARDRVREPGRALRARDRERGVLRVPGGAAERRQARQGCHAPCR